ncbi:unnamed protein product [Sphagnum balticum]
MYAPALALSSVHAAVRALQHTAHWHTSHILHIAGIPAQSCCPYRNRAAPQPSSTHRPRRLFVSYFAGLLMVIINWHRRRGAVAGGIRDRQQRSTTTIQRVSSRPAWPRNCLQFPRRSKCAPFVFGR